MIDLRQGDCLELLKDIPDGSVDMVLTDMPYNITACEWDLAVNLDELWLEFNRIIKPNSAMVFTASQPFTSVLTMSNLKGFKHEWIWEKNNGSNFASVKYQPFKEHESILVFTSNGERVKYYPIKEKRKGAGAVRANYKDNPSNTGKRQVTGGIVETYRNQRGRLRNPSSIQKFNVERGLHPTQKPIALMEYLIKTYSNEGDTVVDMFMGSGSTGVAAVNTNRKFIGIELDSDYFKIAQERINQAAEKGGFLMPKI